MKVHCNIDKKQLLEEIHSVDNFGDIIKNNKLTITTVGFFQGISKMARYKIKMEKVLVTCF